MAAATAAAATQVATQVAAIHAQQQTQLLHLSQLVICQQFAISLIVITLLSIHILANATM
jgi:hypothetical protein